MGYDELLIEATDKGLIVKEGPLRASDGRCKGCKIAIRQDIPTLSKKADTLAEEMGHYFTGIGDITRLENTKARKQEHTARLWAYNKRIGLTGILKAFQNHCTSRYEIAKYLDVSEDTLAEALEYYRQIYGESIRVDNYLVCFEPSLRVYEYFVI